MIKVMVVDDQTLLRETVLYMLSEDEELLAIDGGSNGIEAINNCKKHQPDIILMDLHMPDLGGIEAMKQIKSFSSKTKIIVLTTFEDEKSVIEAIESGADGYVVKDLKPKSLILAVKGVYHDLYIMHREVLTTIQRKVSQVEKIDLDVQKTIKEYNLTEKDLEIIQLMTGGKSNREMAELLNFAEGTVKNKVSRLIEKLGVKDRTQVVLFAIEYNLV